MQDITALFDDHDCALELCSSADREPLYQIFREVVETGMYFPYESSTREEFEACFFFPKARCYVCKTRTGEVIGGFYLKANCRGRSSHIANAAYMLSAGHRGKGLGKLLTSASLLLAKQLGFKAMQYNMVFSSNVSAIHLYEKLGFTILATIPAAVRNPDGNYQAGHIMYRSLLETLN